MRSLPFAAFEGVLVPSSQADQASLTVAAGLDSLSPTDTISSPEPAGGGGRLAFRPPTPKLQRHLQYIECAEISALIPFV